MMAASRDDRLLLISFNTKKELEKEWLPLGQKIIESVKFGKSVVPVRPHGPTLGLPA